MGPDLIHAHRYLEVPGASNEVSGENLSDEYC